MFIFKMLLLRIENCLLIIEYFLVNYIENNWAINDYKLLTLNSRLSPQPFLGVHILTFFV